MKKVANKPVGNQSIATEREIRQIDPIWAPGPVPTRFWQDRKNRRNYLLWLSHKLGCRKMKDLYRLTYGDVDRNHGAGLANRYWRASIIVGIKKCFPEYDWQEWLFGQTLKSFWQEKKNHRRYMQWLGKQLGIQKPEDWYRVTTDDFYRFCGGSFLIFYRSSVSLAVKSYLPRYDWNEWLFNRTPTNFWQSRNNCRRYMRWLVKMLGIVRLDDWYSVTSRDFYRHCGKFLLRRYHDSTALAVMDLVPRRNWCEWKFHRVPTGFWKQADNRRRFMQWLGKQLKYRRPEDWFQVRSKDLKDHCGGSLLVEYHSLLPLLREFLPQLNWDDWNGSGTLREEQILKWAKDYYERHGVWPCRDAGAIPQRRETWETVNRCLKSGERGLAGGSSLFLLLRKNGMGSQNLDATKNESQK